jgi:non-lysosomal glucosylceramidase
MAKKQRASVNYEELTGEYVDCSVVRGFPMGGIGSGGFSINTDGHFTEFRLNNNWMNPIRGVRGTFFALLTRRGEERIARILHRSVIGGEYKNIQPVRSTRFSGELPGFKLKFEDAIPVGVTLRGFTPHIPHNIKDSTIPAAVFAVEIDNAGDRPVLASVLFSWENILGRGGTGQTGLKMLTRRIPYWLAGRLTYQDVSGNYQKVIDIGGRPGIGFLTRQSPNPRSHRRGTVGEYRLTAEAPEGYETSICAGWDAAQSQPVMLTEFVNTGRISSPATPVEGSLTCRPAAAIAVSGELGPGEVKEIVFTVAWWTPDHVTEKDAVKKGKTGNHDGTRVGHIYENFFGGPDEVVEHVLRDKERLQQESFELAKLLEESSLPPWLQRAMKNSIDSTLSNTVVPQDGTMYTLEGMDWAWPYGGLTGTNDQRLSAHPYASVFFTELDMREVDAFRKLMDERGSIPHGNGNCDLALGDAGVPYGWPEEIIFVLPAQEWTDLTMSEIIQAGKLYRITGDRDWLSRFWPDMKSMAEYLAGISRDGVPEGGTTYDVWNFPGSFIYSATVYLAALKTMIDLAEGVEPYLIEKYQRRYSECEARISQALWVDAEGYFQSTPKKNTVFTAALAGDWLARYAGLGPVVEPERARRHLERQYRVLIETSRKRAAEKGKMPSPWSEAKPDGSEVKNILSRFQGIGHIVYVWQVLSYQAMEHIYLGQVELGLEVIKMIYDRIYHKGFAWSAGLMAGPDSVYMTHPVIWAALNAITGAALDAPRGILHLAPKSLPGQGEMKVPFFFPRFWAMMHHDAESGSTEIEVKKHFGKPVRINQVGFWTTSGECRTIELDSPIEFSTGVIWKGILKD